MVRKYAITEDEFLGMHIDPADGHLKTVRDNGDPVDFGTAMGPAISDTGVAEILAEPDSASSGLLRSRIASVAPASVRADVGMERNTLPAWFRDARFGVFAHYLYTSAGQRSVRADGTAPANLNAMADEFDVAAFVDSMVRWGAEYVIFTACHAQTNILGPSATMDAYRPGHTTTRDLIGEVLQGLRAVGIRAILYIGMLGDVQDWIASEQAAVGYPSNLGLYRTFTRQWVAELGNRYGTLIDGYWLDMTFTPEFADRFSTGRRALRQSLLAGNAQRLIIANGYHDGRATGLPAGQGGEVTGWGGVALGLADYTSREYWPRPGDGGGGTHSALRAGVHQTVTLAGNAWWATTPVTQNQPTVTADEAHRFTVLNSAMANAGGTCWAVGPYAGSTMWETTMDALMSDLGGRIDAARPATVQVSKSGAFPPALGLTLGNLAGRPAAPAAPGWVATSSPDGTYEYVHVLIPPSGGSLNLGWPVDGAEFSGAFRLSNRAPLDLFKDSSTGWRVVIDGAGWDAKHTVVVLQRSMPVMRREVMTCRDPRIKMTGSWATYGSSEIRGTSGDARMIGGAIESMVKATTTVGDSYEFTATGSMFQIVGPKSNTAGNYGTFSVSVDGGPTEAVDTSAAITDLPADPASLASVAYRQVYWTSRVLPEGKHTITVTVTSDTKYVHLEGVYVHHRTNPVVSDTGWIPITTFTNSFTAGSPAPAYRVKDGMVQLSGQLYRSSAPTSATAAFTLPVGCRPRGQLIVSLYPAWAMVAQIASTGVVQVEANTARTSGTGYALDGIPPFPAQ